MLYKRFGGTYNISNIRTYLIELLHLRCNVDDFGILSRPKLPKNSKSHFQRNLTPLFLPTRRPKFWLAICASNLPTLTVGSCTEKTSARLYVGIELRPPSTPLTLSVHVVQSTVTTRDRPASYNKYHQVKSPVSHWDSWRSPVTVIPLHGGHSPVGA